jgi:hypothetical protein
MPAVETLRVMPRQMRSTLLEMATAMMDALAAVTIAMRHSRVFQVAAAMRAAPDVAWSKRAGSTAGSQARRTVRCDLRNRRCAFRRKFWQIIWHHPTRGRRRAHVIGQVGILLRPAG